MNILSRISISALGVALLLAVLSSQVEGQPQATNKTNQPITVRLTPRKPVFRVGEPIELRVEVFNRSGPDLFICRDIRGPGNWMCHLELSVKDEKGIPSHSWTGVLEQLPNPNEEFTRALVRDWFPLPAGYFYGTTITTDADQFESLRKPGRYRIKGKYISMGLRAPLYFNSLLAHESEIALLPYHDWKGEVETNSVWIEIVPAKKNGRKKK